MADQWICNGLEPDGYLQWIDLNPLSARASSNDSSVLTTAFDIIASLMKHPSSNAAYEYAERAHNNVVPEQADKL